MIVVADGDAPPAAVLEALRAGLVVGVPTDTVYGLAIDPRQPGATDRLFAVKERPHDVVLPLLVADIDQALQLLGEVPLVAERLMRRFWPGPLTLVVAAPPDLGFDLGGDGATVGVRCPDHRLIQELARATGPVAVTSANLHGAAPFSSAQELDAGMAGVAVVVDGGPCRGEPSTVVAVEPARLRLLRPGVLPWSEVRDLE